MINFLGEDYVENPCVDSESTDDNASMNKKHLSTSKASTEESYPSNKDKSTNNKELRKLKKKYCHLYKFCS